MPSHKIPYYNELLGQQSQVERLKRYVEQDAIPHALLLAGEDGGESLPLALAFARHLLCLAPTATGACGGCASCRQFDALEHPDLYLAFPIIKEGDKDTTSQSSILEFKQMLLSHQRVSARLWQSLQKVGNKQMQILVSEANEIIKYASLRSFRSRYQVVLIWQPELMRSETANKLLKLLEEPPVGIKFLFVSHESHKLLPTITSRLQKIMVPKIPEVELYSYLKREELVAPERLAEVAHLAQGNLYTALQLSSEKESDGPSSFSRVLELLLLPLSRSPKLFKAESEVISKMSRPDVLSLLEMMPEVLRESLAIKYGGDDVVYVTQAQREGVTTLAEELNIKGYERMLTMIDDAKKEIRQNANVKIVFFDFFLNMAMILARS